MLGLMVMYQFQLGGGIPLGTQMGPREISKVPEVLAALQIGSERRFGGL